jgi:DNA-binding NtrC family response regulator
MKRLRLQVRRIGPHFRTVLVSGEPGTGKELFARALHSLSQGASGPFVVCRAAAFGDSPAEWNKSHDGTLFLDGISEMPLEAQDRLLQTLKQYESPQRKDLRIIASAHADLRILVSIGRFRQELHQRLATVDIALPPLRERPEDIAELARHFLGRSALLYAASVHKIADEAMERMQGYRWPGNVRELESVLRKGVLQCEGEVLQWRHLPLSAETGGMEASTTDTNKSARLQDVVEQHVVRVLQDCGGNKLRAAEVLGISRSTLYRMLDAAPSVGVLR